VNTANEAIVYARGLTSSPNKNDVGPVLKILLFPHSSTILAEYSEVMSAANSYESFVLFGNLLNIDEVG
jgi:hypothetical protein